MEDERDVEVFERIPWESLESRPDRRWIVYLVSGALVLGAIGVSLGRQMVPTPAPPPSVPSPTIVATPPPDPSAEPPPTAVAPPPTRTADTTPMWSEADLMALPAASVEMPALARAEWFIAEHFTREGESGRSFVEWVRAESIEWTDESSAEVSVLTRRLAATGDDPYIRLPTEAWLVNLQLTDNGWDVASGPRAGIPPELADGPEGDEEWTDGAGLIWVVVGSDT